VWLAGMPIAYQTSAAHVSRKVRKILICMIEHMAFVEYFNRTMAKPFKWTWKGKALAA
jgi:hypothetical protein